MHDLAHLNERGMNAILATLEIITLLFNKKVKFLFVI